MNDVSGFPVMLVVVGTMTLSVSLRMFHLSLAIRRLILALMIMGAATVGYATIVALGLAPQPGFAALLGGSVAGAMVLTSLYVACRCKPVFKM